MPHGHRAEIRKGPHRGYCSRIKAPMSATDSSTIRLTMNRFDEFRRDTGGLQYGIIHTSFRVGAVRRARARGQIEFEN